MINLNFITMKKVNTIYESKNYSMFKRMRGNREINERHVQYFVKELSKNGMQIPGKINALNEIREGQHRFEACKRLKIPFMFSFIIININNHFLESIFIGAIMKFIANVDCFFFKIFPVKVLFPNYN